MRIKEFETSAELQAYVEAMRAFSTSTPLRDPDLLDGGGLPLSTAQGNGAEHGDQALRAIKNVRK